MSKDSRETESRQRQTQTALWGTFIVVVIIVFLILVRLVSNAPSKNTSGDTTGASPAPAALVQKVTSLPDSVFEAVGKGSANPLPQQLSNAPALTTDGKPRIVYIGAEYCPYCATERWPVVIALSRFGSFSNLQVSHSSTNDVFPNTQTFSFHGSSYSSQYIAFTPVETYSNVQQGNSYAPLDTPTQDEQSLLNTYDAPPYVASSSAGAIPFIDFGGRFLISGSTYQPSLLQNKSLDDIANALSDPSSDISKGAVGAANTITAAICIMTNNQPANVCSTPVIQSLEPQLAK